MFVIITPIIYYFKGMIEFKIAERLPNFEEGSYKQEMFPQIFFQELKPKPLSEVLLEVLLGKIDRLNDIFLEGEFLKGLRNFLITLTL